MRNLLFVFLIFLIGCSIANAAVYSNEDEHIKVTKKIEPDVGDTFNVTLSVENKIPIIYKKYPVYIVLSLDTSGTMKDTDPSFEKTKRAVTSLVDFLIEQKVDYEISIVSWDDNVDFEIPFTKDKEKIESSLSKLKAEITEVTYYDNMVVPCVDIFEKTTTPSDAKKIVVVVTDASGEFKPLSKVGEEYINRAKESGISFYIVAISPTSVAEDIILNKIANPTGGELYRISDISKLTDKIKTIVTKVISVEIKNVTVVDILKGYFDILSTTIPPNTVDKKVNSKLVWNIGSLASQETWSVRLRLKANLSNLPVEVTKSTECNEYSRVEYIFPENKKHILEIPAGFVNVTGKPSPLLKYNLLSVKTVMSPPNPKMGSKVTINAVVTNNGVDSVYNVHVTLFENGNPIDTKVITQLGPGEVKIVKFDWIAKEANLVVKVGNSSVSETSKNVGTSESKIPIPGFEGWISILSCVLVLLIARRKIKY